MKDINKTILLGRLGADPVLRETKKGIPVANFPVATGRRYRKEGATGESTDDWEEDTQWHQVVVWGERGRKCSQYLKKGLPVFIEGSIRSHQYEAKDGSERRAFEVYADEVSFLGTRAESAPAF